MAPVSSLCDPLFEQSCFHRVCALRVNTGLWLYRRCQASGFVGQRLWAPWTAPSHPPESSPLPSLIPGPFALSLLPLPPFPVTSLPFRGTMQGDAQAFWVLLRTVGIGALHCKCGLLFKTQTGSEPTPGPLGRNLRWGEGGSCQ